MKRKKILIVGAGLYGATMAYMLRKYAQIVVIDKADEVAGSCATEKRSGITVHKYGPHIFHTNDMKVWSFVNSFDYFKPFYNEPLARYYDELYHLPFNMNTFHEMFGAITPDDAKAAIEADKVACDNPTNLAEFAKATVGTKIFERLIRHYTEKQWGKKCEELPADFIKRLPLRFTYNNHYFNDKFQGIPSEGYSAFIQKLLDGVPLFLKQPYNDEFYKEFDLIIYSGPIDEYYKYEFGRLEYRSLQFVTECRMVENYQGNAVVNYTDMSEMTRITEHKHFLDEASDVTIITKEIPCKFDGTNERYYPIQTKENQELYEKYCSIKNDKVMFGGRLGSYKYLNMDAVIQKAFEDAIRIRLEL